jgi:DNA-binding transcriptional MerR regulator
MTETISSLADRFGVRPDTLRYYERLGLVRPAGRTDAGYRLYDEAAAERLHFIKAVQRMGLRLGDIKELVNVLDRGRCPCGHTTVLVERRLLEVDAEIEQLTATRRQLLDLKERNEHCLEPRTEEWFCAEDANKGGLLGASSAKGGER